MSPTEGMVVKGRYTSQVFVTDDTGVVAFEVFVDGVSVYAYSTDVAAEGSRGLSFGWNTTGLADGPHVLLARAKDKAGRVGGRR